MAEEKSSKKRLAVEIDQPVLEKYARGSVNFHVDKIKFKSLRMTMKSEQEKVTKSAEQTAAAEILLRGEKGFINITPQETPNTTNEFIQSSNVQAPIYKLKQSDICEHVDLNTVKNQFDLQLHDFGPYNINYSRNGR